MDASVSASRFGRRLVTAAVHARERETNWRGRTSVFAGFTSICSVIRPVSLMASFGMDPASAAERLGHTDGGALFLRTYRHLYEGEKRAQAERFGARVQAALDEEWTESHC